MLSTAYRFIYLHPPKTGGNSIQEILLPLSEDRKILKKGQDGIERFEIRGHVTPRKHARLKEYQEALGDVSDYSVILSVRHPLSRAISSYFSPHRWIRRSTIGTSTTSKPEWNVEAFLKMLPKLAPMTEFLAIDGQYRKPDFVIRYEDINGTFQNVVRQLNLPITMSLPHLNKSTSNPDMWNIAQSDPAVLQAVEERYALDFEMFAY